jgi:hypothetical protein
MLYFTSVRPGGCGGLDIWVSHRHNRHDDFGWETPVNLGCAKDGYVNTEFNDIPGPSFFEDEAGKVWMYFGIQKSSKDWHLYKSEMRHDNTFGPPTPITELNSSYWDAGVTVRRDGLEVFILSNRPGGSETGYLDFWRATRESTADPWSEPVFVKSLGNPAYAQGRIALSFDGRELYFTSARAGGCGGADLYVAKRVKLEGKKEGKKE